MLVSFMTDEDATSVHWVADASSKLLAARNDGAGGAALQFVAEDRVAIRSGPGALWPGLFAVHGERVAAEVFATFGQSGQTYVQGPI